MSTIESLGFIGTTLLIFSSLPQLYVTWRYSEVDGLSLPMLLMWFFGCALTGLYVALTTQQLPLLLNYGFNTLVIGINLYLYLRSKIRHL